MRRSLELSLEVADIGSTRIKIIPFRIEGSQVIINPDRVKRYDYTPHIQHSSTDKTVVKFVNTDAITSHVSQISNQSPTENHLIGMTGLKDALVVIPRDDDKKAVAILSHPSLSLSQDAANRRGLEVHYPGSKLAGLYHNSSLTGVLFPPDGIPLNSAKFNTLVGFGAETIAGENIGVPPDDHHGFGKTLTDFQTLVDEFGIRPDQLRLSPAPHHGIIYMGNDFRSESAFVKQMMNLGKLSKDTLVFMGDTVGKWLYWPDPNQPITGKKIHAMGYATLYRTGGLNRDVLSWFVQPLLEKNESYNRGIERILRKGINGQFTGTPKYLYYPEAFSEKHPYGLLYRLDNESTIKEIALEKEMFGNAEFSTESHEKIIFDMVIGLIFENIHIAQNIALSQKKSLSQFQILGTGGIFDWSRAFRTLMAKGFGEVSHFKTMPIAAVALGMRAAVEMGKTGDVIFSEYPVVLAPVKIRKPDIDFCTSGDFAIWFGYRENAMLTKR